MALLWQKRSSSADYVELQPSTSFATQDRANRDYTYRPHLTSSLSDQGCLPNSQAPTIGVPSFQSLSSVALGKPTSKKRLHTLHALSATLSLVCLGVAIAAVANERFSWKLGKENRQLIVLGFLLGIMNLCLKTVTPTAFLLLEARFGPSTLQNYEGLLRNQVLSARLSFYWRLLLGLMLALPLALSVAYKTFSGGESRLRVPAAEYAHPYASYYGMFAPSGLQALGEGKGIAPFTNATIPFLNASSLQNTEEPNFPNHTQTYGYNVLLLNKTSTAILDLPHPSYLSTIQDLLALGDSWSVTAPVFATVATFNDSRNQDSKRFDKDFLDFCNLASSSSGAKCYMTDLKKDAINLVSHPSPGDLSLHYIGMAPSEGILYPTNCTVLSLYLKPFHVNRQRCQGTWSITRGGIELIDGVCNGTVPEGTFQKPIVNNEDGLFPGIWYMASLLEIIGPFSKNRTGSPWEIPSMATSVAAMMWSRIAAVSTTFGLLNEGSGHIAPSDIARVRYGDTTISDAGLFYKLEDEVIWARSTLRKEPWLYFVLAIQPALILLVIGMTLMFHSTPIDEGFGLISILSGMSRSNLDVLRGSSLSGRLTQNVKLIMEPKHQESRGYIKYHIRPANERGAHNGKLQKTVIYD